jgi:hypothetical protein
MLVIEEEHLLNALVRAIEVLKFDCPPDRVSVSELAGSPFVAEVANRAYDALIAVYRRQYKEGYARPMEQIRSGEQSPHVVAAVRAYIRGAKPQWVSWTHEQKQEYVRILFSPHNPNSEFVGTIIAEADSEIDAVSMAG